MIFDQNEDSFEPDTFSGEPQEEAMPLPGTYSTGPDGEEQEPFAAFPATLIEPSELELNPFPERLFEPDQPPSDLPPESPVEQAAPFSETPSSTDSLMEVIQPAENSETQPDIPAVKQTHKKIIAVGGAKGGVGKYMLAANLAVGLALLGQKVVLADLDLGGADVHLYTGVKSLAKTWNDFLDKKVDSIKDILTPTAFKGLS